MEPDRPSTTAAVVAFLRALAHDGATALPAFADPIASRLLPSPFAPAQRLLARLGASRPWVRRALWVSSLGLIDTIPLRTLAIDAALREGLRAGGQLVILGAGLDARAWRLPALREVTVFEVDHPATQAYKRSRVDGMSPLAREVRFVTVDFERDSLDERLAAAGHRTDLPTFWIWEGVIMYLEPAAMRATLAVVAARSAPRSRLAATYATPGAVQAAVNLVVRSVGEPFRGLASSQEIADAVEAAGLRVLEDSGAVDWTASHASRPLFASQFVPERLVVAERPAITAG